MTKTIRAESQERQERVKKCTIEHMEKNHHFHHHERFI